MIARRPLLRLVAADGHGAARVGAHVARVARGLGQDADGAGALVDAVADLLAGAQERGLEVAVELELETLRHGRSLVVRARAEDPATRRSERLVPGDGPRPGLELRDDDGDEVVLAAPLPAAPGARRAAAGGADWMDESSGEVHALLDALVAAAAELDLLETEVGRLRAELDDTNRGVVALYAELAAAHETLSTVVGSSPLAIMAVDLDGRVESWNPAAEAMFGWRAEEVIGRPLPTIVDEEALAATEEAVAAGQAYADEHALRRHRDGTTIHVSVHSAPLRGADGSVRGRMAVLADTSDRHRIEAERARLLIAEQEARAEAEAAAKRVRDLQFVTEAVLAHVDLDELLGELLRRIRLAFDVETAAVFLLGDDARSLVPLAAAGVDPSALADVDLPVARDDLGRLTLPVELIEGPAARALGAPGPDGEAPRRAGAPLLVGGREIGVLHVAAPGRPHLADADLRLLQLVADRVALAIEHARLYEAEREARRRAERSAEQTAALQRVTAALSDASSPREVLDTVLEQGCGAVRAAGAVVALLDPDRSVLRVVGATGFPAAAVERWREFPLAAAVPLAEAARRRVPVLIAGYAEFVDRYPEAARDVDPALAVRATLPLVVEGRVLGSLGLSFPAEVSFEDDSEEFLLALARQCAQALERARLLQAERDAREESERARERLVLLADASAVLAASLDYTTTLPKLARLLVPRLADLCFVDLLEEGDGLRRHAHANKDPELEAVTAEIAERFPPRLDGAHPVAQALRTGRAALLPDVTPDFVADTGRSPEHVALLERAGMPTSALAVPLVARGRTVGAVLLLQTTSGRRFGRSDVPFAEDLGRRVALAIDNARLYEDRSRVARTLQRSLLPHRLPEVPGVEIAARYRPAGTGVDVGGDFYDVFEVADGSVFVVMGDVCGKGADAAALTGLIRSTVRATAIRERDPAAVLEILNEAVLAQAAELRFATVVCGRLQRDDDGVAICLACGGHPLPFLVRGSSVEQVGTTGSLIGAVEEISVTENRVPLAPGDLLLLYTDGVIEERRPGGATFGEDGLRRLLRSCAGQDADAVAGAVERAVVEFSAEPPRDDVAVLALRVRPDGT